MKTLTKSLLTVVFTLGIGVALAPPAALAAPGDGLDDVRLTVLSADARATDGSCVSRDGLCFSAGSASTMAAPAVSAPVAGRAAGEATQRFVRNTHDDVTPWTIDVYGSLRRSALAGNALFILYDAKDEKALAEHEVTALWQAPIQAGNGLAARLYLTPDDGFRSGHTYRLRVAQLVAGKQVILGEGAVHLQ
jgi:hypothetical protein